MAIILGVAERTRLLAGCLSGSSFGHLLKFTDTFGRQLTDNTR
jgi:hypothetical protein